MREAQLSSEATGRPDLEANFPKGAYTLAVKGLAERGASSRFDPDTLSFPLPGKAGAGGVVRGAPSNGRPGRANLDGALAHRRDEGRRRRVTDRAVATMETEKPWLRQSRWTAVTAPGGGSEGRDGREEATLGMWRALLMGLAVGFLGFWGPLGVLIWRWVR